MPLGSRALKRERAPRVLAVRAFGHRLQEPLIVFTTGSERSGMSTCPKASNDS